MTADVSIVIPTFGRPGLVTDCITSVLRHTTGTLRVEFVVVDDGHRTPVTLPVLGDEGRVRVIRSDQNLGFAAACNLGAGASHGSALIFLNDDTIAASDFVSALVNELDDPSVGIAGARLLYPDDSLQHAGIIFSEEDALPRHVYRGMAGTHPAASHRRELQAVTGACLAIRSQDFIAAGGFSTAFRNGFEDIDLCLRIRAAGLKVIYQPDATLYHLEAITRKTGAEQVDSGHHDNVREFRRRWSALVSADELCTYMADGLVCLHAGDTYPLVLEIAPEIACVRHSDGAATPLSKVWADERFALTAENSRLRGELVDAKHYSDTLDAELRAVTDTRAWRSVERFRQIRRRLTVRRPS